MNKLIVALSLGVAAFALSGQALASGNAANGAELAKKYNCASCHGADYKTPIDPSYPKLAGQHADYLVHALTAYKRGTKAPTVATTRSWPAWPSRCPTATWRTSPPTCKACRDRSSRSADAASRE